jgi:hypothetical protein
MNAKMRAQMLMLAGLGMMAMGGNTNQGREFELDEEPSPVKKIIPKGCQVFTIEGMDIVAANYKNALRKFKNRT